MNRAQRRRATRQAPANVRALAACYRCPDCSSETSYPVSDADDVWHIEIRHDDTCPWLARYERRRA